MASASNIYGSARKPVLAQARDAAIRHKVVLFAILALVFRLTLVIGALVAFTIAGFLVATALGWTAVGISLLVLDWTVRSK